MIGTTLEPGLLTGVVPVFCSPGLDRQASEVSDHLTTGCFCLREILGSETPRLQAMVLSEADWDRAPRESKRPYPFGLPYFTRSTETPTLVFPSELSEALQPRTNLTTPLTVWHELAHAFFLDREPVKMPLWLGELVPQAASAAVALREGVPLKEHLSRIEPTGFTVREFTLPASAGDQMRFQNLLLLFGVAAVRRFGDGFLLRLIRSMRDESEVVDGNRATELFAASLGGDGSGWLSRREEF